MQEYFSNFRRYLGNGQRLSIFGREKDGKLEVFILKCSKQDQFSKDRARCAYESFILGFLTDKGTIEVEYITPIEPIEKGKHFKGKSEKISYHPEIVLVPIEEGNTANYQFVLFCKQFYQKVEMAHFIFVDYLVKGDEQIKIK